MAPQESTLKSSYLSLNQTSRKLKQGIQALGAQVHRLQDEHLEDCKLSRDLHRTIHSLESQLQQSRAQLEFYQSHALALEETLNNVRSVIQTEDGPSASEGEDGEIQHGQEELYRVIRMKSELEQTRLEKRQVQNELKEANRRLKAWKTKVNDLQTQAFSNKLESETHHSHHQSQV
jgi:chromosome segregation ATPase